MLICIMPSATNIMLSQCSQSPILLTLDSLGKSATWAISKDKTWREVG
jgi:hypothetical protein